MSAEAARDFIQHRLRVAGATREIFTPAACECVHVASRGVPRLVNQICDYALVYAFTDGLEVVDAAAVSKLLDHGLTRRGTEESKEKSWCQLPFVSDNPNAVIRCNEAHHLAAHKHCATDGAGPRHECPAGLKSKAIELSCASR